MKNEPKFCECCGQKIMRNRQSFSAGMATILLKSAEHFMVGTPFHLQNDIDFTHNEYTNFQKLKFWGLAEKYYNTLGMRVGGKWFLTIRALKLIRGEEKVESWLETFNNKVVARSPEMIGLADCIGTYTLPTEYAKEQRPAIEHSDGQEEFGFKTA